MKSESPGGASVASLMALLRGSAPYTSWSDESIAEICTLAQPVAYQKGEFIHASHGKPATVSFVEFGIFQSRVTIANGRDHITGYLHPGALLGLSHAFAMRSFAEVHEFVADTEATVWQISAEKFKDLMWRYRPIGDTVLTILATRASNLLDNFTNTVLLSAEEQVARCLLLSLREPNFHAMWINFTLSANNLSQAQLARILGLSRQSVGSILPAFERAGYITMGRQRIEVVSVDALQRVVGGGANGTVAQ